MNGEMIIKNFIDKYSDVLSNDAVQLIKNLTKKDPNKRFSAKKSLESDWISKKRNRVASEDLNLLD